MQGLARLGFAEIEVAPRYRDFDRPALVGQRAGVFEFRVPGQVDAAKFRSRRHAAVVEIVRGAEVIEKHLVLVAVGIRIHDGQAEAVVAVHVVVVSGDAVGQHGHNDLHLAGDLGRRRAVMGESRDTGRRR